MGFPSGSVSFRRFVVSGKVKKSVDQEMLDKLAEHVVKPGEFGVPEEEEWGWCGGRHVLDGKFSFDHNVFNDCLHFAMRVDTNRFPGAMKKAYEAMEEDAVAATNPSGFISKTQKKDVKDAVRKRIEEELKSGKFRRSKLVQVLWDLPNRTLYSTASGKSFEKLADLFERSFGLTLEPVSAGTQALRILEKRGKRREYEDTRPTRFAAGPAGGEQHPDYPWVSKGPEPKDFLGNEFLLWLWHEADHRSGVIKTDEAGDVAVLVDKTLDLDCSFGQTGRDMLKGDGPGRMPEAMDGLRTGKVPRKVGLVLDINKHQYALTLAGESLAVNGLVIPEIEEADTPRVVFEERITLLRDFCNGIDELFGAFLKVRAGGSWETFGGQIKKWIKAQTAAAAA
ncbi:MAG TPA: hypothetical protein VF796_31180 [Humisphaera sp.]